MERLEQTVQSIYNVVDRIDKKFDLLISNQRQESFDNLMSEEQAAESLTRKDLRSEFVDQPRNEDGREEESASISTTRYSILLGSTSRSLQQAPEGESSRSTYGQ
ncbi:hypothetical protein INT45_009829 [Circinella minor]|uniref:Uncharacterized protein n=1 Tax=Circinella minor TaxID=1195481 RepID=A0A8H7S449_9FUNG|nr:hypothetical protein INT45_009829 [Circinella minor]